MFAKKLFGINSKHPCQHRCCYCEIHPPFMLMCVGRINDIIDDNAKLFSPCHMQRPMLQSASHQEMRSPACSESCRDHICCRVCHPD